MPAAYVYESPHGHTRRVAATLPFDGYDVSLRPPSLGSYDTFIVLCPTYGDGELPPGMERFVESVTGFKKFAVCELGNYYGYEDTEFGASRIIRERLKSKGWEEIFDPLSLDSLPTIEWSTWEAWKTSLLAALGYGATSLPNAAIAEAIT